MANEYFTAGGYPGFKQTGDSASARSEFTAIQSGFDKMPAMSGVPLRIIRVNAAGTALESVTLSTAKIISSDGSAAYTADQPMGGFNLTGLSAGAAAGDSVRYEQVAALTGLQINTTTAKGTPVDADKLLLSDSAASWVAKSFTIANLKALIFSAWGVLVAAGTGKTTPVDADVMAIGDSAASNATKKLTMANLKAYVAETVTTIGALINGAAAKSTPVDADMVGLMDSAAANVLKKLSWANLKAGIFSAWGVLVAAGTGKTTPVDADVIAIGDSAASNATKKLTWANLKATMFAALGVLTAAATTKGTPVDADVLVIGDSAASNATKKLTWANLKATLKTYFDTLYTNTPDYIYIRDEKSSGTQGGTFTLGAWRTRDLNTEVNDAGGHASLAANQVTLLAGTYRFRVSSPAFFVNGFKAKLINITDTIEFLGTSELSDGNMPSRSFVEGRFTIAASKVFEVQCIGTITRASNGFGLATSLATEVYTTLEFWKEA